MKKILMLTLPILSLTITACGGGGSGNNTDSAFFSTSTIDADVTDSNTPSELPSVKLIDTDVSSISCDPTDNTAYGFVQVQCLVTGDAMQAICVNGDLLIADSGNDIAQLYNCASLQIVCAENGTFYVDDPTGNCTVSDDISISGAISEEPSSSTSDNTSYAGALSSSDTQDDDGFYFDSYSFSANKNDTISIMLDSNDFDAYLMLVYNDEVIAINDDANSGGKDNGNAAIVATLPYTGVYSIVATSYESGTTGSYILSIE